MERQEVEQELKEINQRLSKAQKQVEQIKGMQMYIIKKAITDGIIEKINTPQGQGFRFIDQKEDSDEKGV